MVIYVYINDKHLIVEASSLSYEYNRMLYALLLSMIIQKEL